MSITIIGMGPGGQQWLNGLAYQALERAELCIGAGRLLEDLPAACQARREVALLPGEIAALIAKEPAKREICVLFSGDTGFYSGAKKLLPLLQDYQVRVLPGLSSVQLLAAALGRPWQDWRLCSAHGRDCNVAALVRGQAETFFLTGGTQTVRRICEDLCAAGLGHCHGVVGEQLGYAGEAIHKDKISALAGRDYHSLAVLLVENPAPRDLAVGGFADSAFIRGETPMTKSEIRAIILSKLRLNEGDIVFDVGAGTGAVAVEAALLLKEGRLFAIERDEEACRLILANACRFGADNLTLVAGSAPEALAGLPIPDAAFIGGSGGKLPEILRELLRLNPSLRLVISAVSLETLGLVTGLLAELEIGEVEIVQVAVSRARKLGESHLLMAQNPIFIISGVGK